MDMPDALLRELLIGAADKWLADLLGVQRVQVAQARHRLGVGRYAYKDRPTSIAERTAWLNRWVKVLADTGHLSNRQTALERTPMTRAKRMRGAETCLNPHC